MDKRKLNRVFEEIKNKAKLDYAVTNPDEYGDCNTCVQYALGEQFGYESKGIYVKHWLKGMNAGKNYKSLDYVYISHDLTEEQAEILIATFQENGYDIEPKVYDASRAFKIEEA